MWLPLLCPLVYLPCLTPPAILPCMPGGTGGIVHPPQVPSSLAMPPPLVYTPHPAHTPFPFVCMPGVQEGPGGMHTRRRAMCKGKGHMQGKGEGVQLSKQGGTRTE